MSSIDKYGIFSISSTQQFEETALAVFQHQAENVAVYKRFLTGLGMRVEQVKRIEEIPFMPIEFFKTHRILDTDASEEMVFQSSGTGGTFTSKHYVTDLSIYEQSYRKTFAHFYGNIAQYAFLALLPSYQERAGSSLIYMVDDLIKQARPESGYFLRNHDILYQQLKTLKQRNIPTILMGVSYALLDLVEAYRLDFPELIVMETGGMKGRRKEMIKSELHAILKQGLGVPDIHAEYGMTELLSQAYSAGGGQYRCPPWMQTHIRDIHDPFSNASMGKTGVVNIIDLANIHSCAFIATQDLGKMHADGSFEILGRFDHSDIRGCNLMVE